MSYLKRRAKRENKQEGRVVLNQLSGKSFRSPPSPFRSGDREGQEGPVPGVPGRHPRVRRRRPALRALGLYPAARRGGAKRGERRGAKKRSPALQKRGAPPRPLYFNPKIPKMAMVFLIFLDQRWSFGWNPPVNCDFEGDVYHFLPFLTSKWNGAT